MQPRGNAPRSWTLRAVSAAAVLASALGIPPVAALEQSLKFLGTYTHQEVDARHVMGVEKVLEHHALIASDRTLCLVDLEPVGTGSTPTCSGSVDEIDATTTLTGPDGYSYVNLRRGGVLVVRIEPSLALTPLTTLAEDGVYFERMARVANRLYVAAHAYGIRIYDVTQPATPTLVGRLTDGFADAWAIAVSDGRAFVADGAGGLKVVDVSDETRPTILGGENPATAPGTAFDVRIIGNYAYVASGGAGVAVYRLGNPTDRRIFDTPGSAEQLALLGEHLAVADSSGVIVFRIEPDGGLTRVARESAMLRMADGLVSLRLWHGVGAWGSDRLLAANWNSLDIYELVPVGGAAPADVTPSTQRLRLPAIGGAETIELFNDGPLTLRLNDPDASEPSFSAQLPSDSTLVTGEYAALDVSYDGASTGSTLILVGSNDPDESPLPIQAFGETPFLDPGEPAVPFTLQAWTFDHETRQFSSAPFDLAAQAGKVVFFYVFNTGWDPLESTCRHASLSIL